MSSGQRPRTREHFPRMKVRGARRKREQANDALVEFVLNGGFSRVFASMAESIQGAALHMCNVMATFSLGVTRVLAYETNRVREYLTSERYQLDLIAKRFEGDPIGHSAAVGEFFTARAHRELDELAERLTAPTVRVENRSGKPEPILSGTQWDNFINRMTGV